MSDRRPLAFAMAAGLLLAAAALLVAGPAAERLHLATRAVRLQETSGLAGSPGYLVATVLLSVLVVLQTVRILRDKRA